MDYTNYLNSKVSTDVEQDITVKDMCKKCELLVRELNIFTLKMEYKPGYIEHIGRCIDTEIANQKIACIRERELNSEYSSCEIIANLELKNICLSIKKDYACIDYKMLIENGKINELSEFIHLVLLCKITAGSVVHSSPIFTLVKRCEAINIDLQIFDLQESIEFFDRLEFSEFRSMFKVDFNLYCMIINPKSSMDLEDNTEIENPINSLQDIPHYINKLKFISLANIGGFMISKLDITSNKSDINKLITNTKINSFDNNINLTVVWSFRLTSMYETRLYIHTEINCVISWKLMNCEITYKGLKLTEISKSSGQVENEDIEIPFSAFVSSIAIRDICRGYESRTCVAFLIRDIKKMPSEINRNCKYLAAIADSNEHADCLCKTINDCRNSFIEWNLEKLY